MPKGRKGQKRPADVVSNAIKVETVPIFGMPPPKRSVAANAEVIASTC